MRRSYTQALLCALCITLLLSGCQALELLDHLREEDKELSISIPSPAPSAPEVSSPESSSDPTPDPQPEGTPQIDYGTTAIGMMTQEYIGENIAEIPCIVYEGENPAAEALNSEIRDGIWQRYIDFISLYDEVEWMEIHAYPLKEGRYLQFVVVENTYPTYGTDGDLHSWCFDREENRQITLDEKLRAENLSRAALDDAVRRLIALDDRHPELTHAVAGVEARGFFIDGGRVTFLLEVVIEIVEYGDGWKNFYSYTPADDRLEELLPKAPVDRDLLADMNPPLFYQQVEAAEDTLRGILGEEIISGRELRHNSGGRSEFHGEYCLVFMLGVQLPERFVDEAYYAIGNSGNVYAQDPQSGQWLPFANR